MSSDFSSKFGLLSNVFTRNAGVYRVLTFGDFVDFRTSVPWYGGGKEEKFNFIQIRTCLGVKMLVSVVLFVLFSTWITVAELSDPVNCTLKVSENSFHDIP